MYNYHKSGRYTSFFLLLKTRRFWDWIPQLEPTYLGPVAGASLSSESKWVYKPKCNRSQKRE
jgi:hypothetical protein